MLASYGLSRTLTPIVIGLLLKGEHHDSAADARRGMFARFYVAFERNFETMCHSYSRSLTELLRHRLSFRPAWGHRSVQAGARPNQEVQRRIYPIILVPGVNRPIARGCMA
jgi:hypothetical protein